jgi:hypothetical protein
MAATASPGEHSVLDSEPPKSKRAGRGRAWTPEEDLNLSKAWVRISEDARTGTGQKQDQFWKRIHAASKSTRSVRAVTCRWSSIRHDVSKFRGLFEAAVKLDESGKNDEDRFNDCLAIFPKQPWNASGQEFQYVECWRYLKEKPKWQFDRSPALNTPSRTKKRAVSSSSHGEPSVDAEAVWGDASDDGEPASDGYDRPQVVSYMHGDLLELNISCSTEWCRKALFRYEEGETR